jgi:uncharacterized protein YdcH (DUF465 family)
MPLSDADKTWLTSRLEVTDARFDRVDARLEQVDARLERVDARFDQVDARFDQVDAGFEQVDAKLKGLYEYLDAKFERVYKRIDQMETTLLTEFHKSASPMAARQRSREAVAKMVDAEIKFSSDRPKNLEEQPN